MGILLSVWSDDRHKRHALKKSVVVVVVLVVVVVVVWLLSLLCYYSVVAAVDLLIKSSISFIAGGIWYISFLSWYCSLPAL